jgi:MATE family multidrug resistance protein
MTLERGTERGAGWWHGAGGGREVLRVAWPLILSNSFWALQISLDRALLGHAGEDLMAAATAAAFLFWTPLTLLQFTAGYATTFVAQYTGAGQPRRVGPAVWQALHFAAVTGLAFLLLLPLAGPLIVLAGHQPELQELEVVYFRCLCFSALPTLLTAAASSYFTGLGHSRTVLCINVVGLLINGLLAYAWIFGHWGFAPLGIAGAGWATVCGTSASALLSLALMLRRQHRQEHATASGWRFDRPLFLRLLRFGLPNGLVVGLETLAFALFVNLMGRLGKAELSATTIAFTLNLIVYFPPLGVGQAVGVLVGQYLGEDRPQLAERSAWSGMRLALLYTCVGVLLYLLLPRTLAELFRGDGEGAVLVPVLLRFVAVYALFDSANLIFSFALRGAGDTRFVSLASVVLSWGVLVVPTVLACEHGWGLYWAWTFASSYTVLLAFIFLVRFRRGGWKSLRVIETAPAAELGCSSPCEEAV